MTSNDIILILTILVILVILAEIIKADIKK